MFNKAFSRVLAGATVAAVCTLGVPALPALAAPSAPTLAVSVDSGSGFTTLVGSSLQLDFQTKNLQGQHGIYVGLTQITGNSGNVITQLYDGDDYWVPKGDDTDTLWTERTDWSGSNNTYSEVWLSSDEAATVKVESFIDMDYSGDWSQGDIVGADKTVSFIKTQDAGLKVALQTPQNGRSVIAGLTSTNADLNLASLDGNNIDATAWYWQDQLDQGYSDNWDNAHYSNPWVDVKESNFKINDGCNSWDWENWFDWNSSTKQLTAELDNASEDYYYQSQLWYYDYNDDEDYKIGGTASVKAGPDVEGSITDITDVTATASANVNPDGTDIEVRTGTKTVVVTGKATDAVAGAHVYVSDDESENNSEDYTVNGIALDGDNVPVAVKADGTFSFTVTTTDATDNDYIYLYISDYDDNDWEYANVYWNAAEPTITNTTPNFSNNSDIALLDREVYTANLELKDQFGQFLTDGTYKVEYTANGAQDDVTFSSGKAQISESFRYTFSNPRIVFDNLYKNDSAVSSWNYDNIYFDVREKNIATYDISESENYTSADPSTNTLVTGGKISSWDNYIEDFGSYVDDVHGANAAYAKVTYSAPGLAFVVNDKVYLNSVTVFSDGNGYSSVDIFGNKTGDYKITVSSGTDSYTETLTINGSDLAPASVSVVDMQTSELDAVYGSGSWVNVWVDFKFFDKFGNPTTNRNFSGSIVGDSDTSVSTYNWSNYNGDGKAYYGDANFDVKDTFSGTKTLKITQGSFSYSLPLVIGAPQLTFIAPAAVKAGSSTPVTFVLKDSNGDPIADEDVTLTLAGKGYLSSNSTTTNSLKTNKLGQVVVNLVTSAADTGLSTITATSDNWDNSTSDNTVFKSASVNIASVLAVPTVKAGVKKLTVNVAYASGKKVVVKVDGKVKYVGTPKSNKVVSITKAAAKGKHNVVVTIGSLTVVNRSVTVK